MILVVASNRDVAALNIAGQILKNYNFKEAEQRFQENPVYHAEINEKIVKLVTLSRESIYAQDLTDFFSDVELAVFISRHSSGSGTATLSVHTPGNLGDAELGGISRKVSISPANAMRDALRAMVRLKSEMHLDYQVSYEGTHHGPSLDVPTMFTELGSSAQQWNDAKAAEAVAFATMEAVAKFGKFSARTVLGIGGPHYNNKFTRIAVEKEMAFGHMIPKYAIPGVDSGILGQCIERTLEKVESAVLDWKGIKGEDKQQLVEKLTKIGISFEKV